MNADAFLVRLGLAIRARREAMRISQEEFADRIGTNRAYYGDVERGTRNFTMRSLGRIAEGLSVPIPILFQEAENYHSGNGAKRKLGKLPRSKRKL